MGKTHLLICVAALAIGTSTAAQQNEQSVPALESGATAPPSPSYPPPPINVLTQREVPLTEAERAGVRVNKAWRNNGLLPAKGEGGRVVFPFGGTMPSLVCAPLYACVVTLQPGETVRDRHLGDKVRWNLDFAVSGSGDSALTHVIIKPTDAGLRTNMVLTTDRRTYLMTLVSRLNDWMSEVSFVYEDDEDERFDQYQLKSAAMRLAQSQVSPLVDASQPPSPTLDFDYVISGDKPVWRPVRVYSDGSKTYIQFKAVLASQETPALVVQGAGSENQLVNYRLIADQYVVDAIFDRAELVLGVGKKQVRVIISRTGKAK